MLRYGSQEDIQKMFGTLHREVEALIQDIIEIVYYMRGAVQYRDMLYHMTYAERQMMADFLKDRIEHERKKLNPVY